MGKRALPSIEDVKVLELSSSFIVIGTVFHVPDTTHVWVTVWIEGGGGVIVISVVLNLNIIYIIF